MNQTVKHDLFGPSWSCVGLLALRGCWSPNSVGRSLFDSSPATFVAGTAQTTQNSTEASKEKVSASMAKKTKKINILLVVDNTPRKL